MISLRPYQEQGANDIRQQFGAGARCVLYVLPCGGGKTYIFTYVAQSAIAKGNPVCILVHRSELLSQAGLSLARMGVPHGFIAPKKKLQLAIEAQHHFIGRTLYDEHAPVQVASVQTLARRLDKVAHRFKLLIPDEAHHSTATQWRAILDGAHHAKVLGVTATPIRGDGQALGRASGGIYDTMVCGPETRELVALGNLVEPLVYSPPEQLDLELLKRGGSDYTRKSLEAATMQKTVTGDVIEHYARHVQGRPAIVYCVSVAHADIVAEQFKAAGYKAASVSGTTGDLDRVDRIEGLGDGRLNVLTSCDIVSEGTDIPACYSSILLRKTTSEALFIQQATRCMRTDEGKDKAVILDHVGNCATHGHPLIDRHWQLNEGKKRDGVDEEDFKQCPACYAWAPKTASKCPECGEAFGLGKAKPRKPGKQKKGDLSLLSPDQTANLERTSGKQRRIMIGKADTIEALEEIAERFGYKPGWVYLTAKRKGLK